MEKKVLKNISYRIYAFFLSLLLFSLSSLVFFTQDNSLHEAIGKEIPNIEINDFTLYIITMQYVQVISNGLKAMRYEDREEIYDLHIKQISNNLNEYMFAPFVLSKNQLYTFSQGADYVRDDGLRFWSKGVYDYKNHIFQGKGEFTLSNASTQANGLNINYDGKNGSIKAQTINAQMLLGSM